MYKDNGRLSIECVGVVESVEPNDDGTATVSISGSKCIVNSKSMISKLHKELGNNIRLEGYMLNGRLHANSFV